jgi:antitoxin VapB
MRTKTFKSGNSQAVRIPAEIAFAMDTELEITRVGNVITMQPTHGSLKEAVELLRKMERPKTIEPIERIELPERDWD